MPPGSPLVNRSLVIPSRCAYPLILMTAAILIGAGEVLSLGLGFYLEGRRNADPSFVLTHLDQWCLLLWLVAVIGLVLILVFTKRAPRAVAGVLLATCALAVTPLQCAFRQLPLVRYETGFLQWTSARVHPAPIRAWEATLPPVTAPTTVPPTAWPLVVTSLKPSNVIETPGGIILEWGMVGAWGNSRRVFIGANGAIQPPTKDENALFNWKSVGPGFYAAYQTTD